MSRYGKTIAPENTPQSEPLTGENQIQNAAGGYVYQITPLQHLERFLILGAVGGTYYASERKLTKENAENILRCFDIEGVKAVELIVNVSDSGRAPKNDPAIFALALAARHTNYQVRQAAYAALPKVCRIPTHLFMFIEDLPETRRWSRGLRNAVSAWYTQRPAGKLAYQLVKYQQRDGMNHARVLRQAHPAGLKLSADRNAVLRWAITGLDGLGDRQVQPWEATGVTARAYGSLSDHLPPIVHAFERLKGETDTKKIVAAINEHGLTREMVPTQALNDKGVWEALLEKMPLNALVRNLGKMTNIGLLGPVGSSKTKEIVKRLNDQEYIRESRLHPLNVLFALKTYQQGHGEKGKLTWNPIRSIVDAMDDAFYLAFGNVVPTGKSILFGLDVSYSMQAGMVGGTSLTPIEAEACLALVTARVEKDWHMVGFSHKLVDVPLTPKMRLEKAVEVIKRVPMGGTDASLPWIYARENKLEIDAVITITDNDTWAGTTHAVTEVRKYRQKMGRPYAKSACIAMTATNYSISDPKDPLTLDLVGFDSAGPAVLSSFISQ